VPADGHNLVLPLTSFVGRAEQIGDLRERLRPGRLLTIVGAGGMGLAAIIAILRLIEFTTWRDFGLAVLVVGAISLGLWFFQPQLTAMMFGSLAVFFVGLVALLLGGIGVASGVHAFVMRKIDTVAVLRTGGVLAQCDPPQRLLAEPADGRPTDARVLDPDRGQCKGMRALVCHGYHPPRPAISPART